MPRGMIRRSVAVMLAICIASMTVLAATSAGCGHNVASAMSMPMPMPQHQHPGSPADTRGHQEKKSHSACDSCGCCVSAFKLAESSLTFAPAFVSRVSAAPLPTQSPLGRIRSDHSLPFSTAPPTSRVRLFG